MTNRTSRSAYSTMGADTSFVGEKQRVLNVQKFYDSLGYFPHPGQRAFHASPARFKVVDAGRRWGKSKAGPHENVINMLFKKPTIGWVVAPTYDLGEKEFRVFWEILVDKMQIPTVKGRTFNNARTKDFRIETAWGSSIEVRSAEHPESLVGEGLDWVIMAEAAKLKLSHWEKYIRPTLSDKRGSAIFVSTPEGFNWFYDLYVRGQSKDHPDWWSLKSPTWHNTIMFPGGREDPEIKEVEETVAEEYFAQEYGAEFTSFAGRIYSEFDEGYHVLDSYQFNPNWPNYVAFDFGFRNPFVCLQVQVDPSDNVYVWDEYYSRNVTTPQHARNLKQDIQWRVDGAYHDPSGADEAGSILQVWHDTKEYRNERVMQVQFVPSPNEWKMGVSRVKEWLKLRDEKRGQGPRPKLFVVRGGAGPEGRGCPNTIKEFNTYRMKEESSAKVSERRDPDESPRKKDDHAMDAVRYFFTGHFGLETHVGFQV